MTLNEFRRYIILIFCIGLFPAKLLIEHHFGLEGKWKWQTWKRKSGEHLCAKYKLVVLLFYQVYLIILKSHIWNDNLYLVQTLECLHLSQETEWYHATYPTRLTFIFITFRIYDYLLKVVGTGSMFKIGLTWKSLLYVRLELKFDVGRDHTINNLLSNSSCELHIWSWFILQFQNVFFLMTIILRKMR